MDANRFDTLARQVGTPTSRRAALGATLASGVLGALGLGRAAPEAQAAQGQTCVLGFTANVRSGPSVSRPLTQGAQPGQLQAQISFTLSATGNVEHGELRLPNNVSVPLVGQATGHSLQVRAVLGPDLPLVAIGVGEQEIAACQGAIDGLLTGPALGDLGDWHAVALQQGQGEPATNAQQGRSAAQPAATAAGAVSQGRGATGDVPTCPRGQTFCDLEAGYCADLMVDPLNCGACGHQCAVNNCTGGVCGEATASVQNCAAPFALCADGCVNLQTDARNCGACDTRCPGGTCANGTCLEPAATGDPPTCQAPRTRCDDQCLDLRSDVFNCGACGAVCAIDEVCTDGRCTTQTEGSPPVSQQQGVCAAGLTLCDETCRDLTNDRDNCGRCGNVCPASQRCSRGACLDDAEPCGNGQERCGNTCVTTTNDIFNCGECGRLCALDETCRDGQCVPIDDDCQAGQTRCNDVCTDLQTDTANCGACSTACLAGEACVDGACAPTAPARCPAGQVRCDGVCREALPNYGSQGISCPGGGAPPSECPEGQVICNGACFPAGACQPTDCAPGWGYCYGVCRDFQNDPGYCGGCSGACRGGYCQGGQCHYCSSSLTVCGQDCVDIKTDLNNCGGCGNRCGTQCINGQCTAVGPTATCAPGTTRCGNTCVDLARDSANCGRCGNACGVNSQCFPPGECGFSVEYCESQGKQACGLGCGPRSDPFNCGGCGFVCPGGYACDPDLNICYIVGDSKRNGVPPTPPRSLASAGQQTLAPADGVTCAPGLAACADVCTDLARDPQNCGACGAACRDGEACQQGLCVTPEASATGQPPASAEDAPQTEPAAGDSEPDTGPAAATCPAGQIDCAGVCTDVSSDPSNCGACGLACAPGASCDAGVCGEPPAPVAPDSGNVTVPEDDTPVETDAGTEAETDTDADTDTGAGGAPDAAAATCLDAGGVCDPAAPEACCSGVCNDDGACA